MPYSNDDHPIIEQSEDDFVRPFLVTGGRTESAVEGLQYETLVQKTDLSPDGLRFEPKKAWALCAEATAIAEISAHLAIPIGTVKVVVGDLITSGHLTMHNTVATTSNPDVDLITRLIAGVERL